MPALLGEVDRGDHPAALGLGHRPQGPQRVAAQEHPGDALGVQRGRGRDDAADHPRRVPAVRPVDRGQPAGLVEVVLHGLAAPAGHHRHELVRVDEAAPAGPDDLLGVGVERGEPLGRRLVDGEGDARARLVGEPGADRHRVAVVAGDLALDEHLVDAGAPGHRGDLGLEGGQLVEVGLDGRPDVQPHVVHVEPGTATERAAGPADRLEAVGQGALDVRQRGDPAVVVAHDDELAHLGQGDEPLVVRVVVRDGVEEQHVLGGLEAGELEVAQPPQVEPAAHHRVHPAHRGVLGHGAVGLRAVREVADLAVVTRDDADGHPSTGVGEGHRRDPGGQRGRGLLRVGRQVGPVHVEVDDGLLPGSPVGHQPLEQAGQAGVGGQLVDACRWCSRGGSRARRAGSRPRRPRGPPRCAPAGR